MPSTCGPISTPIRISSTTPGTGSRGSSTGMPAASTIAIAMAVRVVVLTSSKPAPGALACPSLRAPRRRVESVGPQPRVPMPRAISAAQSRITTIPASSRCSSRRTLASSSAVTSGARPALTAPRQDMNTRVG